MQKVLIIDDNDGVRNALVVLFSIHDVRALTAANPEEGLAILESEGIDLVVQDMNFTGGATSGAEGVALFERIRARHPDMPIILLTAWSDLETAVELVKAGAADYLEKPWNDEKLVTTANNLLRLSAAVRDKREVLRDRERARRALAEKFELCGIVYESDEMHYLVGAATQVAHSDVPILITGPNGAGKEKLAEIVQANSSCAEGPFVKVNIGALPGDLLEAELFGAEQGAYTGANRQRIGRFEAAHNGTLFLDEIGTLSRDGQTRLLRVLQTGEFERLGSSVSRRVRVRVISATNINLKQAIREGRFREDLYYRLNVIELAVPALRERKRDILPLARFFIDESHELSDEANAALLDYGWPGNVRELQNCIRRASLLAAGRVINVDDLNLDHNVAGNITEDSQLGEQEIRDALERCNGVIARAARELGISRQALYRRMEKFGIDCADRRA